MSLQVWLPLNGNLDNLGLSDLTVTNNGATVDNNGKIGKCYRFDGDVYLNLSKGMDTTKDYSICYWVKEFENNTLGQFRVVYQCGGLIVGQYGNYLNIYNGSGSGLDVTAAIDTTAWHHACFTFQSSENLVTIYIDGKYATSKTVTSIPTSNSSAIMGKRSSGTYLFQGSLNDFRIYDHCLSPKEVQELAKGLVLHYRLAGPGQENLIKNSQLATSWGANNICTCNNPTGYSFDGECVKITSGTAGNQNTGYGIFLSTSDISYSVGEKLTFSVDIKGSGEHIALWFLGADGNWWTGANFHTYFTQYDDWTRLSVTGTVPSGAPRMMLGLHAGLSNNTLYAKNMKLERGGVQTPWTPHSLDTLWTTMGYSNNIEYDCSGFRNNGTIKYPPVWDVNSPRYTTSYKFDGTAYLTIPNPFPSGTVVREFSHTAWIKWDSACNTSNGIHSIAYANNFFRFALGKSNQMWAYGVRCAADGSGETQTGILQHGTPSSLVNGKWYFIAFTFKDGVCKAYLDGEQVASTTSTLVGLKSNTSEGAIGAYMSNGAERAIGNISDSRFYVTELSEEAIQELYHSAVIVDNTGKTYAYEYFER